MGYILDRKDAGKVLANIRKDKKVVFTNGCFDIIHKGHIDYLSKAAKLGDIMVLGLNSDESISRIKGDKRPIMPFEDRSAILSALGFIDFVVSFEEDTPYELIKEIVPDILIKGKDYDAKDIVGYDIVTGNGGKVETIELTPGKSTTNIIEKILKAHED